MDSSRKGTYLLTYEVTDRGISTKVVRTVIVKDMEPPVITVDGHTSDYEITIEATSSYSLPAGTATDNSGEKITVNRSGAFTPSIPGIYKITYQASDSSGNNSTLTLTIIVADTVPPIITSVSGNPSSWTNQDVTLTIEAYDEAGGLASDAYSFDDGVTWQTSSSKTFTTNQTVRIRVKDRFGYRSETYSVSISKIDKEGPVLVNSYVGKGVDGDFNFSTGNNGIAIYNNLGNGNVVLTRKAMTTPVGNYVLEIKTIGTVTPQLGGFVQSMRSEANGIYYHRFIAKLPKGYYLTNHNNLLGDNARASWLTSREGTGDWAEYIYVVKAGATGTFSTFGYVAINTDDASLSKTPTWYLVSSNIYQTKKYGSSLNAAIQASDTGSGIVAYGMNQMNTAEPTWNNISTSTSFGVMLGNMTGKGNYYLWLKDGAGNKKNYLLDRSYIDTEPPVITVNGKTSNFTSTIEATSSYTIPKGTATDNSGESITVTTSGNVVPNLVGSYPVTYTATDSSGNQATLVMTVKIVDTIKPTLTVNPTTVNTPNNVGYNPLTGVTATDVSGIKSLTYTSSPTWSASTPGTYTITYTAIDQVGNEASATRTITVVSAVYTYAYTGNYQTFTVPATGTYKIELWGASGGYGLTNGVQKYEPGNGAYTKGAIYLKKGEKLYFYVGGEGGNASLGKGAPASFNGGGLGGADVDNDDAGAGGGATDVRLVNGNWNDFESMKSRIMVAAGGTGGSYVEVGKPGGTLTGVNGTISGNYGKGATQSWYYFGKGSDGRYCSDASEGVAGGGGGYFGAYPGYCTTNARVPGGSSSFISGYSGCNALSESASEANIVMSNQPAHYSGYVFANAEMLSGNDSLPTYDGKSTMVGNRGNGYAKVHYLGQEPGEYEYHYSYTGNVQTFHAPTSGYYQIELWGASGGYGLSNGSKKYEPGKGAYTSGTIYLEENTELFVHVGEQGTDAVSGKGAPASFNGGGAGGKDEDNDDAGAGGGATDIRIAPGTKYRYVRDQISGSTANSGNHWVEIKVFDKSGTLISKGKSVTGSGTSLSNGSRVTDGDLTESSYASNGSSANSWVEIDLGAEYEIGYVQVWHYFGDSRKYYDNVTTLYSGDRTVSEIIHDTAINGLYSESSSGRTSYPKDFESLKSRIMVASGGTGGSYLKPGIDGGALTGADAPLVNGNQGKGATQTGYVFGYSQDGVFCSTVNEGLAGGGGGYFAP